MTNLRDLDKHVPGKRLRNWHRIERDAGRFAGGLRAHARAVIATAAELGQDALPYHKDRAITASRWLAGKGARP